MPADLTIAVASHKPYWMPQDSCYVPVWVGAAQRPDNAPVGWARDNEHPDNISEKNASYCELTALHWLWRTQDAQYLGLAHYRRHFSRGPFGAAKNRVAHQEDLLKRLERVPLVLPRPRHYVIETNYSQYAHAHHAQDLEAAREVLAELYPKVLKPWDESMKRTGGHRFNMMVARRDVLDAWCEFLFNVLGELELRIDTEGYSPNDQRVYGFVSERLLDPWIQANGIPFVNMGVANLESQHWPRKATAFVGRKLRGHAKDAVSREER